jgi:hypothetical protein
MGSAKLKMVRLVLVKLNDTYVISTVENLVEDYSGNGYLNLHEDELDGSLLDILRVLEANLGTLYVPVGDNVSLNVEEEILHVKDTNCTNPRLFGLGCVKDRYEEWGKLLQ